MMKQFRIQLKISIILAVISIIVFGLIYPGIMTLVGQLIFPYQANGSIIRLHGKKIGSALIGQSFTQPDYFWSRPSATTPFPYNASNSSGSNLGPINPDLIRHVQLRVEVLKKANPNQKGPIPMDLVTSSASGLDPDISPAAAQYQAARIAHVRHLSISAVQQLIQKYTQGRWLGIFGEPRVNVLELNLALNQLSNTKNFKK